MGAAVSTGEQLAQAPPGADARDHEASFAAFYGRERDGLVRAVALAVGDASLASEAVDEAFARAWTRWRKVAAYDRPAGWVYRVAVNWARSAWRRLGRSVPSQDVPDAVHHDRPVADPALWAALASINPDQRDAIVLHHVLQWTNPEIAEALGVPVGTVKARIHRGLDALRQEVAR